MSTDIRIIFSSPSHRVISDPCPVLIDTRQAVTRSWESRDQLGSLKTGRVEMTHMHQSRGPVQTNEGLDHDHDQHPDDEDLDYDSPGGLTLRCGHFL